MSTKKGSDQEPMGGELGDAELDAVAGGIKLQRVMVTSWSTSGDADDRPTEEVAFYYNKIAFGD